MQSQKHCKTLAERLGNGFWLVHELNQPGCSRFSPVALLLDSREPLLGSMTAASPSKLNARFVSASDVLAEGCWLGACVCSMFWDFAQLFSSRQKAPDSHPSTI